MRKTFATRCALIAAAFLCGTHPRHAVGEERQAGAGIEFFEKKVRPLLAEHCYECHSVNAEKIQAGLLIDSRDSLIRGGDSGTSLVPGDVDGSLLIEAVRYESYEMPPNGKLPESDIATLERWVQMGAPWPDEAAPKANAPREIFDLQGRKESFWLWQPVQQTGPPAVLDNTWPRQELDRYVLAGLEQAGLHPADDADREALIRRLYFDLVGLPPTVEEVEDFLAEDSVEQGGNTAVERLVDRLLASPHFGERWGRHWLDVVRYAESRGHEFDDDAVNAFQYRDYVIRALNEDVPYDQFVREHIAGDLLKAPRLHPKEGFNESVLGTGFWFLGEWVHSPVDIRKDEADRFDNMIDVMSKAFLGVTVSCARCHDHKFDAISTADYYALSGFLQSSDYRQVRFDSMGANRHVADELAAVDESFQTAIESRLADAGIELPGPEIGRLDDETAACLIVDYSGNAAEPFIQDGVIFGNARRHIGQAYLDSSSGAPVVRFSSGEATNDPIWNGFQSTAGKTTQNRNRLSKLPRSGRTLRTRTFDLNHGSVACRVRGAGHVVACVDSHRLVAGPLHGETIRKIQPAGQRGEQQWVKLNLKRYVGHRLHLEFIPAKDNTLSVSVVTQGASAETLKAIVAREASVQESIDQLSRAVTQELGDELSTLATSWWDARDALRSQIVMKSRTAMAMLDGTGEDDHVLIRGSASNPGDVAPRRFLAAISGDRPMKIESGSGRLELARQINALDNPLTSRVIVNRVWHHLMGRGIVPTTDDFGVLGQRPSHPELLDHLATRFVDDGQSLKRLIRYVALSRTYAMSGHAHPAAVAADPTNSLWHHRPPKRLQGEVIRDALLSVSGRLDPTLFGESIPIHLTPFMEGRGRPKQSGPLDGNGRRSIYIAIRRNFLSPFMLTFDTPAPFSSMGRRNVSNVPAQALAMLNDPMVVEQTKRWAERVLKETTSTESSDVPSRVTRMYLQAFARRPSPEELNTAKRFLDVQSEAQNTSLEESRLWADLAHALVNAKEFIFLR